MIQRVMCLTCPTPHFTHYECSECHKRADLEWRFCPYCGSSFYDLYTREAAREFGVNLWDVSPDQRMAAKQNMFLSMYGSTGRNLIDIDYSSAEARVMVKRLDFLKERMRCQEPSQSQEMDPSKSDPDPES